MIFVSLPNVPCFWMALSKEGGLCGIFTNYYLSTNLYIISNIDFILLKSNKLVEF